MPLPRLLSAVAVAATTSALLAVVPPGAVAGPLGTDETLVSGTTTAGGVGESSVTALPDGRFLTVWEAVRATANGHKREVFGRYVDAAGVPLGTPVLLARLGGDDDATQDVADPVATTLSVGKVALAFAGDVKPDPTGSPETIDRTNWQVFASIIDPAQPLARVTPVQLTSAGHDTANPASSDPAYDQQYPDLAEDHGRLRLVWQGDTPALGDGSTAAFTVLRELDLTGTSAPVAVSVPGRVATRPRVASLQDGGSTSDALVAYESGSGAREVGVARVSGSTVRGSTTYGGTGERLTPDVAADAGSYALVFTANAGTSRIRFARLATTPGGTEVPVSPTEVTTGHDTWPTVSPDPAQPGDYVVSWARRTATAGTGHYEVVSGRIRAGGSVQVTDVSQISSVDADMSADNAESLRPAVAGQSGGTLLHAWSRVRNNGGAGVAVRRTAALVDLTTTITAPAAASPARPGINPATPVTVTVSYGNLASSHGSAPATITTALPGMTVTGTTIAATSGPSPVAAGGGTFTVGRLAPGQGGTVTFTGTLDAAPEGTLRSFASSVAARDLVVDDPPLNSAASRTIRVDHPLAITGITRVGPALTNAASVSWDVAFDQEPTGLDASDVALTGTVDGATVTSVSGSGASRTVSASVPAGSLGTLGLRLRADATASDPQGNALATGNLPFDGPAFDVDRVAPTVSTTALGPDPTNAGLIEYRLDFSEPVTTPAQAQLQVTGGSVSSIGVTGGGGAPASSWTVRVLPSADGTVAVRPLAGAASDPAGNPSAAGTEATRTSDRTPPTATLTGPAGPRNAPYDVTVETGEPGATLDAGDFAASGGAVTSVTGTGPWTVRVTPQVEGAVTLRLLAGAIVDAAGNTSAAVTQTTTYDVTSPTITLGSTAGDPTGTSPIPVTLTASEPVTGLTAADLVVTNGTASGLSGSGASWSFVLTPAGQGPTSVRLPAGAATDAAGNDNAASSTLTRTYDTTGPTPTVTSDVTSPSNAASYAVQVAWDEDVTGFTAADVEVTNGAASGFSTNGRVASLVVTPAGDGPVTVTVPAGAAADGLGNPSTGDSLVVVSDRTRPTVTLSGPAGPSNAATVQVTALFTESVTGLVPADLTVDNGDVVGVTGSGTTWTITVRPAADGPVRVRVIDGAATDAAGNTSRASAEWAVEHDTTATASLTWSGSSPHSGPATMTLTLSDDAVLVPADLAVTNATVALSDGPRVWTVTVTPTADGAVSVALPAGAFTDAAGNSSTASQAVAFVSDTTAPVVTGVTAPTWATGAYDVAVRLSEDVAALDPSAISVANGAVTSVAGSGRDWTVRVTPAADGVVTVTIGAGTATDAAGNVSPATAPVATSYDGTPPTVTLSSPTPAVVTTSPFAVEAVFDEAVTGLGLDDVAVTNGTATNLAGGGTRWTFDVVPAAEGVVTVAVRAAAATNSAGLPSAASGVLARTFDSERPTLALTTTATSPTRSSTVEVTATFSKPVDGFEQDDVAVSGGTVGSWAAQPGNRTWTFVVTPTRDGDLRVSVPERAAASIGGHLAFGAELVVVVDRTAPVLVVTGPASRVSGGAVDFVITADEDVTGLTAEDLAVGGTAGAGVIALAQAGPRRWTATATGATRAGTVTLAAAAGAVTDAAGNPSTAASASADWRPASTGTVRSFTLLQRPGVRDDRSVVLPVGVVSTGAVEVTATSSDPRVLDPSTVVLAGAGETRRLRLVHRPGARGRTRVVVTLSAGDDVRRLALTLVVDGMRGRTIRGTRGVDVVLARGGRDVVRALGGADHVYGGLGDDWILGGGGADVLVGGGGRDRLAGGRGADLFVTNADRILDWRPRRGDERLPLEGRAAGQVAD